MLDNKQLIELPQTTELNTYRPENRLLGFSLFMIVCIVAFFAIVGTVMAWSIIKQISPIITFTLLALGLVGLLAFVGYSLVSHITYKRDIQDLHVQAAAQELELKKEEVKLKAAQTKVLQTYVLPADNNGNRAAIWTPEQGLIVPPEGISYPPVPNVPHTLHYEYKDTSTRVTEEREGMQVQQQGLLQTLPQIEQFYDAIPFNSLQTGLGADKTSGKLILAQVDDDSHFKFVGASGGGKSCGIAAMLDIATTCNDAEHLQIGILDLEWKTGRLFEHLPHVAEIGPRRIRLVGRDAEEVANRLEWLVWEMKRRARLTEHELDREPLLLVYVEEMLALKLEIADKALKKKMLADINLLGVRARKYRIRLLAAMQTDYSDTSTRDAMHQFKTRGGFDLDVREAQAAGFKNTELIKQVRGRIVQGQYVLEKPDYQGLVLAPFYDVKARLKRIGMVLSSPTNSPSTIPYGQVDYPMYEVASTALVGDMVGEGIGASRFPPTGTLEARSEPFTEQERRIIQKFIGGLSPSQIVASEFTDTNGNPLQGGNLYKQKCQWINDLIRRHLMQASGRR